MVNTNGVGAKFFVVASVVVINSLGVLYFARDSINLPHPLQLAFGFVEGKLHGESNSESTARGALRSQSEMSLVQKNLEFKTLSEAKPTQSNLGLDEHAVTCSNRFTHPVITGLCDFG
ncbi:hypothetical protein I533_00535 [Alteromonas mediterranea MED64]|uniref:hypothetical protein n=1 Tax=Alteromonas mediterranea TaxID=314275 RepID=UPI0003557E03|nr:hypothetical protein [Alteromonas mediterranea]AGP80104.1 hypothetical protein I533_00535 [Alteromonas mediterranea MED64]